MHQDQFCCGIVRGKLRYGELWEMNSGHARNSLKSPVKWEVKDVTEKHWLWKGYIWRTKEGNQTTPCKTELVCCLMCTPLSFPACCIVLLKVYVVRWPMPTLLTHDNMSIEIEIKCLERFRATSSNSYFLHLQKYWSAAGWGLNKNCWLSPLGSLRSTAWNDAWGWILYLITFFAVTRSQSADICLSHLKKLPALAY